jgi:hypothetical protein
VQGQHVAELRVVGEAVDDRTLGGPGVAEQVLDAVADQAVHQDVLAAHVGLRVSLG